jgi:hypothetical protein
MVSLRWFSLELYLQAHQVLIDNMLLIVAADPLRGLSPTGVAHLSQSKLLPLLLEEASSAADQLRQSSSGQVRTRSAFYSCSACVRMLVHRLQSLHFLSLVLVFK